MKKILFLLAVVASSVCCYGNMAPTDKKPVIDSVQVVRGDSMVTMNLVWVKSARPKWLADSLNKALVRQFFKQESADIRRVAEAEADSFCQEYLNWKSEMGIDENANMPAWERKITVRLDHESEFYYTFYGSDDSFMGGMHNNKLDYEYSVDKKTGQTLSWAQLFRNPNDEKLANLVRTCLEEQFFTPEDDQEYYYEGDIFPLPKSSPAVLDGGILFHYQSYEIVPYVYGLPCCVIPYKRLMPYLRLEILPKLPLPEWLR